MTDAPGHAQPPKPETHLAQSGTHLIIDLKTDSGLDDLQRLETAFRQMVEVCGATLLHIHTHRFSPNGVSGVAVLAESHISAHTWPDIGYGAFDVFMCGAADPWRAIDVLKQQYCTTDVTIRALTRSLPAAITPATSPPAR